MKKLNQHKSFIYHGDNLLYNKSIINNDLSELLETQSSDLFNSEDVWEYDCKDFGPDEWEEVSEHFLFKPTGTYKVLLFENAEELSLIYQNKLLKPIEDSKDYMKVIFNTKKNLIGTIHSRSSTIRIVSDDINTFPHSIEELFKYFDLSDNATDIIKKAIVGISKSITESSSMLIESGLIKEKSKALDYLATKVQEIAKLIILYEVENHRITSRSIVVKDYLEIESNTNNLYLLMLELEM